MSHIEIGRLHAYLDGECAEREVEQIEAHLVTCDECQERLTAATAASRTASDLLAEVEPGALSAPTWRELEERAAARARSAPRRTWVKPSLAWAAVIAIAFGVGWFSNNYWSSARYAPASSFRGDETPVAVADALEAAPRPQAPAQTQTGAAVADRSAEPEFADEDVLYDRRVKSAAERPETRPLPGRGALTEGGADRAAQEEALAAARQPSPPTENLTQAVTEKTTARPPAEEPAPAVAGVEATRELAQRRERQDIAAEMTQPEAEAFADLAPQRSVVHADEAPASFFSVQPEAAAAWLNGDLRTLPDLHLQRVEVGPGTAVPGALPGLPAVRLVYEDAAGHPIVLVQQRLVDWAGDEAQPVLSMDPGGEVAYRWTDAGGYHLILTGTVSSDSLRALAARLR
ncbi:MAG: zf-HC2 domain-containing protein [Gemmatimonadales bacterium]